MDKKTLWQIAAIALTLILAVVLFRFVANRGYPIQCPTGTCASNWGQDDTVARGISKEQGPLAPLTTLPSF